MHVPAIRDEGFSSRKFSRRLKPRGARVGSSLMEANDFVFGVVDVRIDNGETFVPGKLGRGEA